MNEEHPGRCTVFGLVWFGLTLQCVMSATGGQQKDRNKTPLLLIENENKRVSAEEFPVRLRN